MGQLIELPVEHLSPESFAPFGEVIEEFPDATHAEGGFEATRRVGFTIDRAVDLHVIRYDFKPMEFRPWSDISM